MTPYLEQSSWLSFQNQSLLLLAMSWCLRYSAFSARTYPLLPITLRLRARLALRMPATPCLKNSGDLITLPSASKESVSRLFIGDAFVLYDLATSRWRTFDSLLPVSEKQPVRSVYPVGYLLYSLTSHITPVAVFIRVAQITELFLEFVFIQKLPCFGIVILYDCQCRVVYDPGDIYHITKISKVVAAIQFYRQCSHDIIIAHFMALRITAFHPMVKAHGLTRRLICNLPLAALKHASKTG